MKSAPTNIESTRTSIRTECRQEKQSVRRFATRAVLAVLDYAYQRWKHEQDVMMSHQEVREEMKNMQGDPQVIARRRQVRRQLALERLESAVPKADVGSPVPDKMYAAAAEILAYVYQLKGKPIPRQRRGGERECGVIAGPA